MKTDGAQEPAHVGSPRNGDCRNIVAKAGAKEKIAHKVPDPLTLGRCGGGLTTIWLCSLSLRWTVRSELV